MLAAHAPSQALSTTMLYTVYTVQYCENSVGIMSANKYSRPDNMYIYTLSSGQK